jgi:hypothetical protein
MSRLLDAMKAELTDKIIPGLSDPTLVVNVQMMTALLGALSVRVEHELDWMRAECARIEAAADTVLAARPGATAVADALATYRAERTDSLLVSVAQADYERAGELLSRLAEEAYASSDAALVALVEQLFAERLATEQAAIGTFVAVGR